MKKILLIFVAVLGAILPSAAQCPKNDNADAILGEYLVPDKKNFDSKVRFTKNANGTYDCQVFWLAVPNDPATGKPWLDSKNPDKSARGVRCDQIFIIKGLKYDGKAKVWGGVKIYDPNRGISANVKCRFTDNETLEVRGTLLGLGETHIWKKLK